MKNIDNSVQKVLDFIETVKMKKIPFEFKANEEKLLFIANQGIFLRDPSFFKLINPNENPKEFFKKPYGKESVVDLNVQDEQGNTLLHYMGVNCHFVPLADYLLEKGANPDILNFKDEPALKFNAHRLNGYAFGMIEKTSSKYLNCLYSDGETILTDFFKNGSSCHIFDVAYVLIKAGADINLPNQEGKNPLYYLNERIKGYEKDTKGYENLKYAINELIQMGATISKQTKVCSSQKNYHQNKPSQGLEREF